MKIYVTLKSIAKRKAFLEKVEFQLTKQPETIGELISELVSINVRAFNERQEDIPFGQFFTKEEMIQSGAAGKVDFAVVYNEHKANEEDAIKTAIQAFQDGFFKVFIKDVEQGVESPSIQLNDGDHLVFIKLTMLAGRMW
ncbi:hypothetical protein [Neobacillus sp.]|uniref:hypothetical protein n=1 Tax=Neobacillus sp. TaxID=2675273 RepID=UPI0028A2CDC5|nr:hypothetical protein [Neobacillus sp.]